MLRSILWHCFQQRSTSAHPNEVGVGDEELLGGTYDPAVIREQQATWVKMHDGIGARWNVPAIYIIRDGREATVSYWRFLRQFGLEQWRNASLTEVVSGEVRYGSWSQHYRHWDPANRPNTLLVRYEEMKADVGAVADRIAEWTGLSPRKRELPDWSTYKATNPHFFRSGTNKTWKGSLVGEALEAFWKHNGELMKELGYGES